MGDIALPNVNYENEWKFQINKTMQQELERLKQEVYNEGLQVEEEGLTEIVRKKTKHPDNENHHTHSHHNHQHKNTPIDKNLNEAIIVSRILIYFLLLSNLIKILLGWNAG